jgi:suppressor of cytokine signaling 7
MTVKDVRTILHNIYSNTTESSKPQVINVPKCSNVQNAHNKENVNKLASSTCKIRKHPLLVNIKHKKSKDNSTSDDKSGHDSSHSTRKIFCLSPFISSTKSNFSFSLKQTFCNIFRSRKNTSIELEPGSNPTDTVVLLDVTKETTFEKRALPPVPNDDGHRDTYERETSMDFATSIEKVKDV